MRSSTLSGPVGGFGGMLAFWSTSGPRVEECREYVLVCVGFGSGAFSGESFLSVGGGGCGGGRLELRDACRNRRARLHASQVRARMYDDLALLPRPLCFSVCSTLGCLQLLGVALVQQRCYSQAECSSLGPAAICQRGVVGCGRAEVPCFIRSIETSAVSLKYVSLVRVARIGVFRVPGDDYDCRALGHGR
jgi:hypothetical protein